MATITTGGEEGEGDWEDEFGRAAPWETMVGTSGVTVGMWGGGGHVERRSGVFWGNGGWDVGRDVGHNGDVRL